MLAKPAVVIVCVGLILIVVSLTVPSCRLLDLENLDETSNSSWIPVCTTESTPYIHIPILHPSARVWITTLIVLGPLCLLGVGTFVTVRKHMKIIRALSVVSALATAVFIIGAGIVFHAKFNKINVTQYLDWSSVFAGGICYVLSGLLLLTYGVNSEDKPRTPVTML